MAKTTVHIALTIGAQQPATPAYVAFRSPYRLVDRTAVNLPEPAPIALDENGEGVVAVDPGVWLVDEIVPTTTYRRAVIVPASATAVEYSTLLEVTDPAEIGFGPTRAGTALAAAGDAAKASDAAALAAAASDVALRQARAVVAAIPTTSDALAVAATGAGPFNAALRKLFVPRVSPQVVVPAAGKRARGAAAASPMGMPSRSLYFPEAGHEWWTDPIAIEREATKITYGCAGSPTGEIIAWDRERRNPKPDYFVVGDAGVTGPGGRVDDHDWPARWTSELGDFSAMFWSNHGDTDYFCLRVSLVGAAYGFLDNAIINVVVAPGAQVSYTQAQAVRVTATEIDFWVLTRTGTGWGVQPITVSRTTGQLLAQGAFMRLISIGGLQPYVSWSRVGNTIRFAAYVNPAYAVHKIWVMRIDVPTRQITSPVEAGFSAVLGEGPYIDLTARTPFIAETATTGESRRMYYISPVTDAVVYSQWTRQQEKAAIYKEAKLVDGNIVTRNLGPEAGKRNGYTAAANYNPGMAYSPDGSLIATLHNKDDGTGEIWIHSATRSWLTRKTDFALSRPTFFSNNELGFLAIDYYNNYGDLLTHQVSIVGFPELGNSEPAAPHPLRNAGSIVLLDPTYDALPWEDVRDIPPFVPNLADGNDLELVSTIGSEGIAERSRRGGVHSASALNAGGNQSIVARSQTARDRLATAIAAGHKIFVAEAYVITREAAAGYAPNSATARFGGAISTTSADIATLRPGTTLAVRGYPTANVIAAGEKQGDTLIVTGQQWAAAAMTPGAGTLNDSTSLWVQHNGGANSPAPSRVTYLFHIIDLTAANMTEAAALQAMGQYVTALYAAGGRYANDSWTPPAVRS